MSNATHCAECGAPLPENWPKGLCSRCALQGALVLDHADRQAPEPEPPPAPRQAAALLPAEKTGDRIGHYKLLQQIGEGGCGVVYMAEQEAPVRRRVALKIIKLGMDTRQVIARFEAERQALALMDHPNIARVFDAGATDAGRPYFVMELVRGVKITDYCDENQLSTRERLDLFAQVCKAIQHAHQKGIIHRDIKPSNILVTVNDGLPVPKVIDFGVAKATQGRLTDQTLFTAFEQFIGTPAYMSPEQAVMTSLDIDTRSDIYSLGVLLYELLTGKTPFDTKELLAAGLDAMRRTIREKEPSRPSTRLSTMAEGELTATAKHRQSDAPKLMHLLRGDLDWIVMKCLEKDRTRRYETANGLAADVQRHLSNEPITARPPSATYRFQKLVGRNKVAFAAAAVVAVTLMFGVVVSTWQAIRATANEKKAATEAARSVHVAQLMKDMLKGVGPAVARGRDTELLREILTNFVAQLNQLKDEPAVEADLRETLGVVYRDLGDFSKAELMLQESVELRRKLYGNENALVASSLYNLAEALRQQHKDPEAEKLFTEALAIRRRLFGNEHRDVAASLYGLGEVLRRRDKLAESEAAYREALAMRRKLFGNDDLEVACSLGGLAVVLANPWQSPQKRSEAEARFREALDIQRRRPGSEDDPTVAYTLRNLGNMLDKKNPVKRAEGETLIRQALDIQKRVLGDHRDTAMSIYYLANTVTNRIDAEKLHRAALTMRKKVLEPGQPDISGSLGDLLGVLREQRKDADCATLATELRDALALHYERTGPTAQLGYLFNQLALELDAQGKLADSEAAHIEALAIRRKLRGNEHPDVASSMSAIADVLRRQGKEVECERMLTELRDALETRYKARGGSSSLADSFKVLGREFNMLGRPAEAKPAYQKELAIRRALPDGEPAELAVTLANLTHILLAEEKFTDAEPLARESLAIREKLLPGEWRRFNAQTMVGGSLLGQKKYADAEPLLLGGYEGMKQREGGLPAEDRPHLKAAFQRATKHIAQLYEETGRPTQAAEWKKKLGAFDKEK